MARANFNAVSALLRILAALVLVFLSYNPYGGSYYHWALIPPLEFEPLRMLAGVVLLIAWIVFLRATGRSLGPIGFVLATAFFGLIIWLIIDWFHLQADSLKTIVTLVEIGLALVLGAGMSWSHIRRRLTGQYDVDEIEN